MWRKPSRSAVDGKVPGGRIYEAGGPEIRTLRDLVDYVLAATERRAIVLPLPKAPGRVSGKHARLLDRLTLGLLPDEFVMTRDQAIMLETDNVVSARSGRAKDERCRASASSRPPSRRSFRPISSASGVPASST